MPDLDQIKQGKQERGTGAAVSRRLVGRFRLPGRGAAAAT
jgi:hypothetical protein